MSEDEKSDAQKFWAYKMELFVSDDWIQKIFMAKVKQER